ncbi:MAG: hypothetical protein GX375_00200 [Clostridiales bacterium]|nr:hypothetical protein [Clostridiales bacterium]
MLFSRNKEQTSIAKAVINPGTVSVVIGMVVFLFPIELPNPVSQVLDMVGSMTAPLSMLIVGALLGSIDLKSIFIGFDAYYGSLLRLILMPMIAILALSPLGIERELLGVCVVVTAMPAAANTAIFAEKFDGDSILGSRSVGLSTILSIITIPLIMMLV